MIPKKYRLKETESSKYSVRTHLNVIHSDATLILPPLPLTGGTALTAKYARKEDKALFTLSPGFEPRNLLALKSFWASLDSCNLNIAGPRFARDFAMMALSQALPSLG